MTMSKARNVRPEFKPILAEETPEEKEAKDAMLLGKIFEVKDSFSFYPAMPKTSRSEIPEARTADRIILVEKNTRVVCIEYTQDQVTFLDEFGRIYSIAITLPFTALFKPVYGIKARPWKTWDDIQIVILGNDYHGRPSLGLLKHTTLAAYLKLYEPSTEVGP